MEFLHATSNDVTFMFSIITGNESWRLWDKATILLLQKSKLTKYKKGKTGDEQKACHYFLWNQGNCVQRISSSRPESIPAFNMTFCSDCEKMCEDTTNFNFGDKITCHCITTMHCLHSLFTSVFLIKNNMTVVPTHPTHLIWRLGTFFLAPKWKTSWKDATEMMVVWAPSQKRLSGHIKKMSELLGQVYTCRTCSKRWQPIEWSCFFDQMAAPVKYIKALTMQ